MRNTAGGKKHKKQGNISNQNNEIIFADSEQNYGKVMKLLGHSKFEIMVFSKNGKGDFEAKTIIGNARPRLKKKRMFANKDCFVIVSLRDFQESVCDIVHVYKQNHVHILNKKKLIPSYSVDIGINNTVDVEFETGEMNDNDEVVPEQKNKSKMYLDVEMDASFSEDDDEDHPEKEIKYDDFGNIV